MTVSLCAAGRVMGPGEAELRRVGSCWWWIENQVAQGLFEGAIISLQLGNEECLQLKDFSGDVMSEAIEAAAALGL